MTIKTQVCLVLKSLPSLVPGGLRSSVPTQMASKSKNQETIKEEKVKGRNGKHQRVQIHRYKLPTDQQGSFSRTTF